MARYTGILASLSVGDPDGASSPVESLRALAERLRDRFWMSMAQHIHGDIAQLLGDWSTVRALFELGLAASPTEPTALCSSAIVEYQSGDFASGEVFLERLAEAMRRTPRGPAMENGLMSLSATVIADVTGNRGRLDVAKYAAQQVLSTSTATPWVAGSARIALGLLSVD
ncbi:MAG TPA: hypothetical protein DCE26_09915 [Dehalococcoidia bacterium]|nr:hypothetical protein [Dehalococcoidia bacterium]